MAEKLGFYELLEPHFSLGLAVQNANGSALRDLRDANAQLNQSLPGASATLSRIVTGILDYLSIEELHSAADETAVVYVADRDASARPNSAARGAQTPICLPASRSPRKAGRS